MAKSCWVWLFVVMTPVAACSGEETPVYGSCDPPRTLSIGEPCQLCDHCAASAGALGFCSEGTCAALRFGVEGDGPCVATLAEGTIWSSLAPGAALPEGATVCGLGAGCTPNDLYCDQASGKCKTRNAVGASCAPCESNSACPSPGPCASGGFCGAASVCEPVKTHGAACTSSTECDPGFCSEQTCRGQLQPGVACTDADRCTTHCLAGTCASSTQDACRDIGWKTSG